MTVTASSVRAISRGLIVAAVASAFYVASRRRSGPPPTLIQWDRVRSIAAAIATRSGSLEIDDALSPKYAEMVAQSQEIIARYTGEELLRTIGNVFVLNRVEWLDANVAGFRELFAPLEDFNLAGANAATLGLRALGDANQLVLSSQMGLLLGYLSQRVLGQYDLALLGREPVVTGRLYFVEPNIHALEQRLGLEPDDFRMWIALHETTHAYEFESHPWLREHMNGLIRGYFATLGEDIFGLRTDLGGAINLVKRIGRNAGKRGHAVEWFMTPEQREIFNSLQALMCLLEGYSNHVMDKVGESLLPSYPEMKRRFNERNRRRTLIDRLFAKLTGLNVKMEQYALGERFVNETVARAGVQAMNRVWAGPANLPTMEEIRSPELWLTRVSA